MLGAGVSLEGSLSFGDSALGSPLALLGVSSALGVSSDLGLSSAFGVSEGVGVGAVSEFGAGTDVVGSPFEFVGVVVLEVVGSIVTVGETRSKPCSSAPTEPTVATVATAAAATTPLLTLKCKAFLRFISFDMYIPQSFC